MLIKKIHPKAIGASIYKKRSLFDLKTGSGIYEDHIMQLAAYRYLWSENRPDEPLEEIHVVRVGKEDGSFTHRMIPLKAIEPAWEAFKHALALHQLHKKIKKLV